MASGRSVGGKQAGSGRVGASKPLCAEAVEYAEYAEVAEVAEAAKHVEASPPKVSPSKLSPSKCRRRSVAKVKEERECAGRRKVPAWFRSDRQRVARRPEVS